MGAEPTVGPSTPSGVGSANPTCTRGHLESEHWRDGYYSCPGGADLLGDIELGPGSSTGGGQHNGAAPTDGAAAPDGAIDWAGLLSGARAATLRPGDRVLLTIAEVIPPRQGHILFEQLKKQFPDVTFTLVIGVNGLAIQPASQGRRRRTTT